jgi:NADH pyrophosphatase NudC (nudix superfamily)
MHSFYLTNYNFCPKCGAKLKQNGDSLHCQACGFNIYPNPAPATSIFVIKNNQVLLAKRKIDPKKGAWDSPGGFIEVGESVEAGAIREMKEETGLDVKIIEILGSHPDSYDDKPTFTIGLLAEIIGGELAPADDVASLHWIDLDKIPDKFGFESVKLLLHSLLKKIKQET